ncbi:hypothetical protein EMCRGX_G033003 [Ephydatia muelleri]
MTTTKKLLFLATCCFVACASLQIPTKEKVPIDWMAQEQSLHPMGPHHKEMHDHEQSKHNGSHHKFQHDGTVHPPHHMKPNKQSHGHRNHSMEHETHGHHPNHPMDHEAQKHFKEDGHPHFPRPTNIPEIKHLGHMEHSQNLKHLNDLDHNDTMPEIAHHEEHSQTNKEHSQTNKEHSQTNKEHSQTNKEHSQNLKHLNDLEHNDTMPEIAHHKERSQPNKEHSQTNDTHHRFREGHEFFPKPSGIMREKGDDHKNDVHSYHHVKPSSVPQERTLGKHDHPMEHEARKQFKNGHSHFLKPTNFPEMKHMEHGDLKTKMVHHKENSTTNETHHHQLQDGEFTACFVFDKTALIGHRHVVPEPTGVMIAKRNDHKNSDHKTFHNTQSRLHHLIPTSVPNEPHYRPHAVPVENKGYFRFPKPTTVPEMRMRNGPAHKQH